MHEGVIGADDQVVIIEDVATTGGQVLEAARTIEEMGAKVNMIISVIDRQEGARERIEESGYSFEALFTVAELGIETPEE